jgi:hypothetical protein
MHVSLLFSLASFAQNWYVLKANGQRNFEKEVPAGNYSGIVHVGADRYFVVNDKSETDGFCDFSINIDSITGEILNARYNGFKSCGHTTRDGEGITFLPHDSTILVVGEADNKIKGYRQNGTLTGKEVVLKAATGNLGYESLTYNAVTHTLWTANESTFPEDGAQASPQLDVENIIMLQSFNDSLMPKHTFLYKMDRPSAVGKAWRYALGVSELTACDDGTLFVLEREFFVPKSKIGAFVNCKIYQVYPKDNDDGTPLTKHLLYQWKTSLNLFKLSIANYEGMCLGPRLKNGSQVLVLVSDSQNQYAGVMKDWFKTLVIKSGE